MSPLGWSPSERSLQNLLRALPRTFQKSIFIYNQEPAIS